MKFAQTSTRLDAASLCESRFSMSKPGVSVLKFGLVLATDVVSVSDWPSKPLVALVWRIERWHEDDEVGPDSVSTTP